MRRLIADSIGQARSPSCFVSYAWGNQEDERWVERRLCSDLRNLGVDVILDRWDNAKIGSSIPRFISRADRADFVLVVGTPEYLRKWEASALASSVLSAEMDIIGNRLIGTEREKASVLPVLRSGTRATSLPPLLQSRTVAMFTDDNDYFEAIESLVLTLFGIPADHASVLKLRDLRHRAGSGLRSVVRRS